MTEVGFYHLTTKSLDWALAKLLERALALSKRVVVLAGSTERVESLSGQLWTYDPNSFLPHGTARDGFAEHQPVWLTAEDENPNGAQFIMLIDGQETAKLGAYERCFEVFDGRDADQVAKARAHWTAYKAAGHEVTYWKQTEAGGWEKGA
jgi:DNA polymerase-3 subunit chi